TADLRQIDGIPALLERAVTEYGHIDILVNNAGLIRREDAIDLFIRKKEASSGSFDNHLAHSAGLIKKIGDDLRLLDKLIVHPNA
ncbi:SDR family NAD(P)-dependent oxidoreductase, partial [Salmonella enterica subsp. enterica serovar Anatum]|nr:SDR family NAD(P)-dependent oxidoreductase [Salmonella enterica subsp. enterica serovar Anatum]